MITFIYFGRLVKEKGIEIVLDTFRALYEEGITHWHLDIYGPGPLEAECRAAAASFPNNITFHGRGDNRAELLRAHDFCLMPSLILESFGLTALEAIRTGTPIIGFKKGGTDPFIVDELNIELQPGETNRQKLFFLIQHLLSAHREKSSYLPNIDLNEYSTLTWLSRFKEIAGNAKRILIVSDFIKRIGGIENYVNDAKQLLETHGYTVELRGTHNNNTFRSLLKTGFNISARRKLRKKIKKFQPDLVRCNSVIRELGRLPLTVIPHDTKVLMMFHDVGYFHPYASRVFTPTNLPKDASLRERIRVGEKKGVVGSILLTLKRLSLRAVKKVFRSHSTTYLVPSDFMKPFSDKRRAGEGQKTIVLPHFVK